MVQYVIYNDIYFVLYLVCWNIKLAHILFDFIFWYQFDICPFLSHNLPTPNHFGPPPHALIYLQSLTLLVYDISWTWQTLFTVWTYLFKIYLIKVLSWWYLIVNKHRAFGDTNRVVWTYIHFSQVHHNFENIIHKCHTVIYCDVFMLCIWLAYPN